MKKCLSAPRSGAMNMSTISVLERIKEASPRIQARIAGVLYLIMIVTGISDAGTVEHTNSCAAERGSRL